MKISLSDSTTEILARLKAANTKFARTYPGESDRRQPVHTVYGGAHLFSSKTAERTSQVALASLREYAPDAATLCRALGLSLSSEDQGKLHARIVEKLTREALEDFRIDFEDGYGNRPDAEEDGHAARAAEEVAQGLASRSLPPFIGIRIKPFNEELCARSLRTLDIFVSTLAAASGGKIPEPFVVTLPKVTIPEQVTACVDVLEALEKKLGLRAGCLELELMVETTQSIIAWTGHLALPDLVTAARGRCSGAHFGTYDYTASCSITAAYQGMTHPACDFARSMMQVALGGTGIFLSDGATNVMPVGPHRAPKDGPALTPAQQEENRTVVHRAWKLGYDHIRHSLETGFYQGWDLHPAQLPIRYAALYAFFFEGLASASLRLRSFMEKAAQATLVGDVFDDAATGQGLLNYFLRAQNCGAITAEETERLSGLSQAELRSRSFAKILTLRSGK